MVWALHSCGIPCLRKPSMKPKLYRTGRKHTSLIQALRSYISTLRNNAQTVDTLVGEPANRVYHKSSAYTHSSRFLADCYQTDLSAPCTGNMAADVALNFPF